PRLPRELPEVPILAGGDEADRDGVHLVFAVAAGAAPPLGISLLPGPLRGALQPVALGALEPHRKSDDREHVPVRLWLVVPPPALVIGFHRRLPEATHVQTPFEPRLVDHLQMGDTRVPPRRDMVPPLQA